MTRYLFIAAALLLHLLHPLLHPFEGGTLDAVLIYADGLAANAANLPAFVRGHRH